MKEPLPPSTVKRMLASILTKGTLAFTRHAYEEMAKDLLTEVDVRNTLKGGVSQPGELALSTWRYRVVTSLMASVVGFRSELHAVVITAWRLKKR